MAQGQKWKNVEQVEGPFENNENDAIAYVMVYTALNDNILSVAKDRKGATLAEEKDDFRAKLKAGDKPDVGWAIEQVKAKEKKEEKEHAKAEHETAHPHAHAPHATMPKR